MVLPRPFVLISFVVFGISFALLTGTFLIISSSFTLNYFIRSYVKEGLTNIDYIVPFWISLFGLFTALLACTDVFRTISVAFSKVSFYICSSLSGIFWIYVMIISFITFVCHLAVGQHEAAIGIVWILLGLLGLLSCLFLVLISFVPKDSKEVEEIEEDQVPGKKRNQIFSLLRICCHCSTWIFFLVYFVLISVFTLYGFITAVEHAAFKPHGEMFQISAFASGDYATNQKAAYSQFPKSWKMHIYCTGIPRNDTPTILLSHGGGSSYLTYFSMQQILSNFTQVCSFDRAGYGYSDVGPFPRSVAQSVAELHELLQKKGITQKLLFVGHSAGGNEGQFFAYKYPNQVSGLLRMDSPHEFYYVYEGMANQGLSKDAAIQQEFSRLPLIDIIRHASAFGLTRIFTNGNDFKDPIIGVQHTTLYGTKNWNSQYFSFESELISDTYLNLSRWDVTPQSNGITGQMFGNLSLHIVKASDNKFNKTCADKNLPPSSQECIENEKKRQTELWLIEDYRIRSSNSKVIVCEKCNHGFITNSPEYASQLVLDQLQEIKKS
jgi:pimeloyl-ACP methyl ester carboxylesterase